MARAGPPDNTHTSAPSRRTMLASAAASVAASGIFADGALAGETLSCPEFDEWQRLAMKTRDWFASKEFQEAPDELSDALTNAAVHQPGQRMDELEQILFARPVSSIADVMMLGVIALYWNDGSSPGDLFFDGKVAGLEDPDDSIDNRSSGYLIRAICMLAKATGQFPALASSNFDPPPIVRPRRKSA